MKKETKLSPCGAPVLNCEDDHECTVLTCDYCLKELPTGDAVCEEGRDYVAHFCGLDCLAAWRECHTHEKKQDKQ